MQLIQIFLFIRKMINSYSYINEYKLNYKLSKEIFETNRDNCKLNQYYNNTFPFVSNINIDTNKIEVLYGFIYRKDINIFTKYCFVLYSKRIIDHTAMFWSNVDTFEVRKYLAYEMPI